MFTVWVFVKNKGWNAVWQFDNLKDAQDHVLWLDTMNAPAQVWTEPTGPRGGKCVFSRGQA